VSDNTPQPDFTNAPAAAPVPSALVTAERRTSVIGDLVRGALIGVVETVPGVSGGTVALVVGIYARLIQSASNFVSAVRVLVTGPNRRASAKARIFAVEWKLILPVFIGMVVAVFTVAGPMATLVETYPELTRATFFGLVLASIAIPLRMAGVSGIRWSHVCAGLIAAVVAFWLVSLPPTTIDPTPVVIVVAAAVAVSALLLPGLSGSFLLLTFGLYEPTLRAVDERNFSYLALFVLGMTLGVASIVKGLEWLLHHRRRITLVILTGVMVGAMRTLWPWQGETRELLAPGSNWPLALALAAGGFVLVSLLAIVDAQLSRRAALELLPPTSSGAQSDQSAP
jgi:putative membrane protein